MSTSFQCSLYIIPWNTYFGIVIFWVMTLYNAVGFRSTCCLSIQGRSEDGGNKFLCIVGNCLQDDTASQSRRPQSIFTSVTTSCCERILTRLMLESKLFWIYIQSNSAPRAPTHSRRNRDSSISAPAQPTPAVNTLAWLLPGIPIRTRYKPPRSAKSTVAFKNS